MKRMLLFIFPQLISAQVQYNHPNIEWRTFETKNFRIHYYAETETSARKGAYIAERIYAPIVRMYQYSPVDKTDIVFKDTDDISNGAAYFYDNKIIIWTSPLDFELRGSHRWLQNVITHEFAHIVSIQKAQKFGKNIPGAYLQFIGYEKEKRPDVLYGYPNVLVSFPIPGTMVPPWLAEGAAQYMYPEADWDNWDSHRDMILRDRTFNNNLLSWSDINSFGKSGIGNESVYNTGYAFTKYIASRFGPDVIPNIFKYMSKPMSFSVSNAINNVVGIKGEKLYSDFINALNGRYKTLRPDENDTSNIRIIEDEGTANLHPVWNERGNLLAYLSNKDNDYFSATDLFVYDLKTNSSHKIARGVTSPPTWSSNKIFFSKRSPIPNKAGSRYFDLYEYDIKTKKEKRITKNARAFSPAFNKIDSTLFYLATFDGTQNIFKINLKNNTSEKISNYGNHEILNNLKYDTHTNRLIFDITFDHFKNIHYLDLSDSTTGKFIHNKTWDSRNADTFDGGVVYSEDRTGIFNLYYIDSNRQGYITNVEGGAFMPSINQEQKLAFSLYKNGRYQIGIIDSLSIYASDKVGYSNSFHSKNNSLQTNISGISQDSSSSYKDHFPPMFLMPRTTVDYGTFKIGTYFFSSEILEKVNLIGGLATNSDFDLDLFFLMEYRHLFPTLFFETYYMTRNKEEKVKYSAYNIDNKIKFRLLEFKGGIKTPFYGSELELFTSWSQYRASIKESIIERPQLRSGYGYEYYKSRQYGLNWDFRRIKPTVDQNINPLGLDINIKAVSEQNDFIDELDLSDAGTLTSKFNKHNLIRLSLDTRYSLAIPKTKGWTSYFGAQIGQISNKKADEFFHFFGGGQVGLKGYPYYSLQGTDILIFDIGMRLPIFKEKSYNIGPVTIKNMSLAYEGQIGDAWDRAKKYESKISTGVQLRMSGYSFYNYPIAIGLEFHKPHERFFIELENGDKISYGDENRVYFNILFGF